MHVAAKFDRWMVVVLFVGAAVSLGLPTHGWIVRHQPPLPAVLPIWLIWIAVLVATLPQYYEVRGDGLFIRQGWRKALIPYASLVELQPNRDARGAGVFSMDRILVVTKESRTFVIAPADPNGFLDAVAQRSPQLERKGFGLALPFSAPTIN